MISRSLIAAAGNAGAGGLSYWVTRIQTGSAYPPTLKAVLDTVNENITVINTEQLSGQYVIELDYDGGLIDASSFSNVNNRSITLMAVGSDKYYVGGNSSTQLGLLEIDSAASSSFSRKIWNTFSNTGQSNYDAYQNVFDYDQETVGETRMPIVRGGYQATNFPGFGVYYRSAMLVFTYVAETGAIRQPRTIFGNYDAPINPAKTAMIARGTGQKYCCFWTDPSVGYNGIGFGEYSTTNSGILTNIKYAPYTAQMENKGVFIDSENKMSAVASVTTTLTKVYRGTTANDYSPNFSYHFNHNSTLGELVSTAMDSEENIYLLYRNSYLVKFSSSNTIAWCLKLDNTLVGEEPSAKTDEVKVETIDDTEFLLLSLVYPRESGQNYCWYVVKAPIDLNNYLGTYGNIQISNYSFSPTVTTTTLTSFTGPTGNELNSFTTYGPATLTNSAETLTVSTTTI